MCGVRFYVHRDAATATAWRRDAMEGKRSSRAQVCPAPKPINEFAEALAAAARADESEGANKAVDAFEQTAEASAARKLKMTEALAKRVKKKREDRLALWADDGDRDDDDEACASHKLAVVLEEVKGRGADFRHLREVRLSLIHI